MLNSFAHFSWEWLLYQLKGWKIEDGLNTEIFRGDFCFVKNEKQILKQNPGNAPFKFKHLLNLSTFKLKVHEREERKEHRAPSNYNNLPVN